MPRRDLTVRIGDVTVSPALALGAWAGFSGTPDATMMGDLVVTAEELKPVLAELTRQRVDVTAIHNHLVGESPTITYVQFLRCERRPVEKLTSGVILVGDEIGGFLQRR
jgi:hypothetical protein